ncbi:MAG: LicD family protein [Oscillospiraceae bacterium]|nr:LicD family protein [Oscillospiraceae bacterium]
MNEKLSAVQAAVLENMKLFDRICQENGLRYFATGGTGLGMVRHKGFIPWDDDADLSMPRADFEKLKTVTLPEGFILKERPEYLKSMNFINTHKKIRSKLREEADNHDFEFVSVDIFPMDGAPDNKFKRTLHVYKWLYYLLMIKFSEIDKVVERNQLLKKNRKKKEAFLIKVGVFLKPVLHLDREKLEEKFYRHITKYDYDKSSYVACYIGRYRQKEIVPIECFGKGKRVPFEDMMIMSPDKPEIYLSSIYGDFMKLPPENQRESHNFDDVEDC